VLFTDLHKVSKVLLTGVTYKGIFLFNSEWDEAQSTSHRSENLTYYTSPGWQMMTSVERSVEWEMPGENEVLEEYVP
jgi:hypothetical protein